MRRLPNDNITITDLDNQGDYLYADAFYLNGSFVGGHDTITINNVGDQLP